jgi:hypothetical protein
VSDALEKNLEEKDRVLIYTLARYFHKEAEES